MLPTSIINAACGCNTQRQLVELLILLMVPSSLLTVMQSNWSDSLKESPLGCSSHLNWFEINVWHLSNFSTLPILDVSTLCGYGFACQRALHFYFYFHYLSVKGMLIQKGLSSPVIVKSKSNCSCMSSHVFREQLIQYNFSWICHPRNHEMLEKTRLFNLFYGHCQGNGIHL